MEQIISEGLLARLQDRAWAENLSVEALLERMLLFYPSTSSTEDDSLAKLADGGLRMPLFDGPVDISENSRAILEGASYEESPL